MKDLRHIKVNSLNILYLINKKMGTFKKSIDINI